MRILIAASIALYGLIPLCAHALDDTPTQTPYLAPKKEEVRVQPPAPLASALPAAEASKRTPPKPAPAVPFTTVLAEKGIPARASWK